MSFFDHNRRGIVLQQHKEPALSREIITFTNASTQKQYLPFALVESLEQISPEDIIDIAKQANIIDERDGRLLYKKLIKADIKKIKIVVADAMDDEPYISSQLGVLLNLRNEVIGGLAAVEKVLGSSESFAVVYKDLHDLETRIPKAIKGLRIRRIGGKYPAEMHVKSELNLKQPYVIIGVCALVHLYRAIYNAEPQTTGFITVAGNCIGYPTNLEVELGMTLTQVLERCGLIDHPTRVIIGGSMTGISVIDTENTVISPVTRGVLAFKEDEKDRHYQCIGCGRCISYCPRRLSPMRLYKCITLKRFSLLDNAAVEACIGCGTCSYVCPSKLHLSATIEGMAQSLQLKAQESKEVLHEAHSS